MQTEVRYADLMNDDVFKIVFGQESSKDVMIEFLNLVITDRAIVDLDFMDKEMKSLERDRKDSIYDLLCKTDDGTRIVVEVQRRKQETYIERTIYYSTFQVRNQVEAGSRDYAFCPVYVINLVDFDIDECAGSTGVRTVYRFYEETSHKLLIDKLTLIYIELNKFKKTLEELDGDVLEGLCFCFKNIHSLKERPKVLKHRIFDRLFEICELMEMDEATRTKVIKYMTTERDLRNQMAYATKVAIAEGLAEAVRRMIDSGMERENVATIMRLSVEEIDRMLL